MRTKSPEALVDDNGALFFERKALLKAIKQMKKNALENFDTFYEKRIGDWVEQGEDIDIRAERAVKEQTKRNISIAIDNIVKQLEKSAELTLASTHDRT